MTYYMVRLANGEYVGRMNLTDPLGPVAPPFAATFTERADADTIASEFGGTIDQED